MRRIRQKDVIRRVWGKEYGGVGGKVTAGFLSLAIGIRNVNAAQFRNCFKTPQRIQTLHVYYKLLFQLEIDSIMSLLVFFSGLTNLFFAKHHSKSQ